MPANDNWYWTTTTGSSTSIPYQVSGGTITFQPSPVLYSGGGYAGDLTRTVYRHPDGSVSEVPPAPKTALERLDERIMATRERARKALAAV
jgi:hypothetical protein